jgi:hypothetical protein
MKSRNDEGTQRVLLLLKIDANNLFKRVRDRKIEYLEVFALRRTRTHFPGIFANKFESATLSDLAHCSTELITTLDQYYAIAEEMNWYLFQTEDMPGTVELFVDRKIKRMENHLASLNLFLNAELGIENEEVPLPLTNFIDTPAEDVFSEPVESDTPQES